MNRTVTLEDLVYGEEDFRDHIPYEDAHGKRRWIYPRKPRGRFHKYRQIVAFGLLGLFFTMPHIRWHGQPFFLINIFERKFVILGQVFWPQDTHLLILLLLIFFVTVILFTVAFGRIWCGWTCPQTVFMEMVFRKIEYWVEGDASAQRKLDRQPWNAEKIRKKSLKHALFIIISLLISHTVMMYLVGRDKVFELVTRSPAENWPGFLGLVAFTGIFYFVFSILREHACTFICPYGRLQGVLINPDTLVVAYDFVRGEPRGKLVKGERAEGKGDCVDCGLCVQVCPTGIDIRNGTQLECVNCTACIDACDEVMDKVKKPKGLVRFASLAQIREGRSFRFTWRMAAYSGVLLVLVSVFFTLIFTRNKVETTILRATGQLYNETSDGKISNLYNVQVINKSFDSLRIRFEMEGLPGVLKSAGHGKEKVIPPQGMLQEVLIFEVEKSQIPQLKNKIQLKLITSQGILDKVSTTFLGPPSKIH
ncbi:MAG: cytochrome c oxidase accessory protein CcoG [Flavobacteriales bacterium]|nr:cytochrome c oxidase accessory protein CcoG [Flavobacteriales bacterium]